MTRNSELLHQIADHIEANPMSYEQVSWARFGVNIDLHDPYGDVKPGDLKSHDLGSSWNRENVAHDCGTTACIAGWATFLHGNEGGRLRLNPGRAVGRVINVDTDEEWTIDIHAARVLGLTEGEAEVLFNAGWRPHGWEKGFSQATLAKLAASALRALADDPDLGPLDVGFDEL